MIDLNALELFVAALSTGSWFAALAAAETFASKLTAQDVANLEADAKTAWLFACKVSRFLEAMGARPAPSWPMPDDPAFLETWTLHLPIPQDGGSDANHTGP